MAQPSIQNFVTVIGLVAVAGGAAYFVSQPNPAPAPAMAAWLADAGVAGPTHIATCQVRLSDVCLAAARDAGIRATRYMQVDVPVAVFTGDDGGLQAVLPPGLPSSNGIPCVDVLQWSRCIVNPCDGGACGLWGKPLPMVRNPSNPLCYRKNVDAGFPACFTADGGDPGDMNVYPAAALSGTCQPTPFPQDDNGVCYIRAGDSAEAQ